LWSMNDWFEINRFIKSKPATGWLKGTCKTFEER
jgi:hypothetical protein